MIRHRVRLYEAFLRYPVGQAIHTAASGRIEALHEFFLEIEDRAAGVTGWGEVRANIAFITGTPEADVRPGVMGLIADVLRGTADDGDLMPVFERLRGAYPKICQALLDNTLVDLAAKRRGRTVAEELGGSWKPAVPCNECVFWGSDADMARNAESYVEAGFSKIKLRVGIGTIEDDLRRLAWLRDRFGGRIRLAADANGAWSAAEARRALDRFAVFAIDYLEQPTHKGDWPALEAVARHSPVPIMIDEGLQSEDDVARVCANGGRITAHLKIAKAGGVRALVDIARRFDQAGVGYVVGQMNEGAVATAVSVHAAMALNPMLGELYGALGIANDPGHGIWYKDGQVGVPRQPGIGIEMRPDTLNLLWDSDSAA